jgi:hypothetical protein
MDIDMVKNFKHKIINLENKVRDLEDRVAALEGKKNISIFDIWRKKNESILEAKKDK